MPTEFQKIFTIELPVHIRKKANGVYEARFRRFGYNISVSSTDYDKLKGKFFSALLSYKASSGKQESDTPPNGKRFGDVASHWLELRSATIKAISLKDYHRVFETNIFPILGEKEIGEIRQSDIQALINDYIAQGKLRTATKLYQTLKAVFEFAVGEDLIEKSPMRFLHPPKYEENKGCALTKREEEEFLKRLRDGKCSKEVKDALLLLLYSGIRRSELKSVQLENGFLSVVCAKVRKGLRERRRMIPVTPMLAACLPEMDLGTAVKVRPDALTQAFKRMMPDHHLHELRHTFITRCQECGVAREVVSVWAGHAPDQSQTSNVYTHFSREFMLQEAQKVIYK